MTIKSIRRWTLFRPLAAVIAILVLPVLACLDGNPANAGMFKAAAQGVISGCNGDGTNKIIQNFCVGSVAYSNDLQQLEADAVNGYIGEHGLTTADAALIYSLGRSDLRTEIRAQMLAIMIGIIKKAPSARTAHEQTLFNWLTALVQQNEIALYSNAVNQFQIWQADPCTFQLDPVIASAYNLSYDGSEYCGSPLDSLLAGPPVPAESYFTAYGMRKSYAAPGDTFSNFSALVSGTATDIGEIAGIATAVGVILSGISTAAVANSVAAAADGFLDGMEVDDVAEIPEIIVGVSTAEDLGTAFLSTGPAAIILVAIAIGVAAGEEAFSNEAIINDLKNMEGNLTQVTQTPPDLVAFNFDTTGQGSYKIQMSMVAQTVPELASSAPLPTHQLTDASFAIQPNGSNTTTITPTLSYKDWTGNVWSAQTSGGWFVQTCSGSTCTQADSINGTLHYLDWSGAKWSAARIGNNFVHQKAVPASTDKNCAPDLITKVTAPPFTNCMSYTTSSVPMTAGDGSLITMSLSALVAPVFTSPATLSFLPGIPGSQTIVAAGNPTPSICLKSTTLPSAFSLNGGSCGSGSFQLTYDGTTSSGSYTITLSAAGAGAGTGTSTFTVVVTQQLSISSPSLAVGTAAFPFSFLVTTTGYPKPALSIDPNFPLGGLTFHDNGDGTATISGVDNSPDLLACSNIPPGGGPATPCGIIATNAVGTVEQAFQIEFNQAPIANVVSPLSTTFYTGIQNHAVIASAGAITPVSWQFAQGTATWATLQDNSNGTATLMGTPPVGTSGAFAVGMTPVALGTGGGVNDNTAFYTINVVDSPVFSSANTATFTVGTPGLFNVLATQGTVSALNTLPNGLSFNSGNPPNITGTPAAGTGGQYIVKLADDGGTAGTATQDLNLQVNEGANITSPNDAIFFVGTYNVFPVTTTGFPYLSNHAVGSNFIPPTDPSQGQGMFFTATGAPSSFTISNTNNVGFATGTLTIQGIPGPSDVGTHLVQITAQNGVGAIAHQTLTLQVLAHNPAPQVNLLSNWVLTRDSSNNVIATTVLANNGSVAAQNVMITTAKIGTASGTILPAQVPTIPAESTATFSIVFPAASVGAHGSAGVLTLSGSFTGGTFNNAGRIVLP
jgi:hypothetical protein